MRIGSQISVFGEAPTKQPLQYNTKNITICLTVATIVLGSCFMQEAEEWKKDYDYYLRTLELLEQIEIEDNRALMAVFD